MKTSRLAIALLALGTTFASLSAVVFLSGWLSAWFSALPSGTQALVRTVLATLSGVFLAGAALIRSRQEKGE